MGIGPSTKETSLHHFRDPLLDVVSRDTDIDLQGVLVLGTPQGNAEKLLVGTRAVAWIEAMRTDGVIISLDGWGNSHVDFAKHHRADRQERYSCSGNELYRDGCNICSKKMSIWIQ